MCSSFRSVTSGVKKANSTKSRESRFDARSLLPRFELKHALKCMCTFQECKCTLCYRTTKKRTRKLNVCDENNNSRREKVARVFVLDRNRRYRWVSQNFPLSLFFPLFSPCLPLSPSAHVSAPPIYLWPLIIHRVFSSFFCNLTLKAGEGMSGVCFFLI